MSYCSLSIIKAYLLSVVCGLSLCTGCGLTKSRTATEQLLISNAIDRSVDTLEFRYLSGKKVYLDATYLAAIKVAGYTNATGYITSSIRQRLFAAHCLVQEKKEDADYILEARIGALGFDSHDVTYGIPASSALSSAATLVPNTPQIPMIPEIAVAKRNSHMGAAKISIFAYHRETKQPIWQSGIALSKSSAGDLWVMGAGPFQSGTIFEKAQFAGSNLEFPTLFNEAEKEAKASVSNEAHFILTDPEPVRTAAYEESISDDAKQNSAKKATKKGDSKSKKDDK